MQLRTRSLAIRPFLPRALTDEYTLGRQRTFGIARNQSNDDAGNSGGPRRRFEPESVVSSCGQVTPCDYRGRAWPHN